MKDTNSKSRRGGIIGLHPNLDVSGVYVNKPLGCDPALYHPQSMKLAYQVNKKSLVEPWTRQIKLKEWSENLGYRKRDLIEQRRTQRQSLGPAWHEPKTPIKPSNICSNIGFTTSTRFKYLRDDFPPPGTYRRDFNQSCGHSSRPLFERDMTCRFPTTKGRRSVAPNRYNIIDKGSLSEKIKIVISKRGPYDLFTGLRDDSTVKNHFAIGPQLTCATWPIALPGCMDRLNQPRHRHYGEFNESKRDNPPRNRNTLNDLSLCIRSADEPGPASYDAGILKVCRNDYKENMYPFNCSHLTVREYKKNIVWPPVGRYNISSREQKIPGKGHKYVFQSQIKRTIGGFLPQTYNSF